jgi:hypothetical protein
MRLKINPAFIVFICIPLSFCRNAVRDTVCPEGILNAGEIEFIYFPERGEKIESIYLSGDFNDWAMDDSQYAMTRHSDGSYRVTVTIEEENYYNYKYRINGRWVDLMKEMEEQICPRPLRYDRYRGEAIIAVGDPTKPDFSEYKIEAGTD